LYQQAATGSSLNLSTALFGGKPNQLYFWTINGPGVTPHRSVFMIADASMMSNLNAELRGVSELPADDQVAGHLYKALVYQDHECFANAVVEYRAALQVEHSQEVRDLVRSFLIDKLRIDSQETAYLVDELGK
jgi:hypothetical protein